MQPTVSPSSLPTCWLFSQATNQFIAQYITIGTLLFEDNFLCWLKKLSSNNKATFRYIIWFKTVSRLLFLFLSLSLTLTLFFSVSLSLPLSSTVSSAIKEYLIFRSKYLIFRFVVFVFTSEVLLSHHPSQVYGKDEEIFFFCVFPRNFVRGNRGSEVNWSNSVGEKRCPYVGEKKNFFFTKKKKDNSVSNGHWLG